MNNEKGVLFVISGPSGSGKSTVLKQVFAALPRHYFSVSATTRSPRPGEVDGKDYHFITRDEFEKMIREDKLLEHAKYVDNYYGTPSEPIDRNIEEGTDVFLDIEVQGHAQIKAKRPDSVSVFIAPPSLEELEKRLRGRSTDTEEAIAGRLSTARRELAQAGEYDYIVINDKVDIAASEILSIVSAEKCRAYRKIKNFNEV